MRRILLSEGVCEPFRMAGISLCSASPALHSHWGMACADGGGGPAPSREENACGRGLRMGALIRYGVVSVGGRVRDRACVRVRAKSCEVVWKPFLSDGISAHGM